MKIIILTGKTSTGKDSAARYIEEEYGIHPIVSYTTRDMRVGEVNGREHYFVSEEEMDDLEKRDDILAWTKFDRTGIRYCASTKDLDDDGVYTYILNPNGIKWLREHYKGKAEIISLYFDLSETAIIRRALIRGDIREVVEDRLDSEREQFDAFKESGKFDALIDSSKNKDEVRHRLDWILAVHGIEKRVVYKHYKYSNYINTINVDSDDKPTLPPIHATEAVLLPTFKPVTGKLR